MRKEIQEYLQSGVTAYHVAKQLGVAPNAISRYIDRSSDIGKMTLERAEALYELALEYKKTAKKNKNKEKNS